MDPGAHVPASPSLQPVKMQTVVDGHDVALPHVPRRPPLVHAPPASLSAHAAAELAHACGTKQTWHWLPAVHVPVTQIPSPAPLSSQSWPTGIVPNEQVCGAGASARARLAAEKIAKEMARKEGARCMPARLPDALARIDFSASRRDRRVRPGCPS
jgi:hypothetical protein